METLGSPLKILFVYLAHPRMRKPDIDKDVTELWNLVGSMGNAEVIDLIVQKGVEFQSTYIGPGKAREVGEYLKVNPVDIIVLNGNLKPGQKFTLMKMYWRLRPAIRVWDRVDLILNIFSLHARTIEAKLQIDLASMRHMGPRIFGMGMTLSRQGGGIGTRGIGETNTELMRRHWKREIKRVTDELAKSTGSRMRQMEHRKNMGLQTISIVGYTNAGKTTLFNLLTHKKHLVENALFATLDSTVGEIFMPSLGKKVIVSDTIGFIANLPPELIEAFTSTLMESVHADVVLHVIDASIPDMVEKIDVVFDILDQLHIPEEKEVLVFNKVDAAPGLNRNTIIDLAGGRPYVFISAKTHEGVDQLVNSILPRFVGPTA
ncbi:GTPase HflX [Candidatus Gottesmanbacteria bacterium RIFCSPLOWO2_01_FULL_46_9]|uniref:GTPase HflX n=1 Tax=Candidatus Gottesmanbacteria bacterium RIFCSPLOWO2_01_FULL_46_9 TaxID=1798394 RepID=A0A1F6AZF7_9BACT|nr:MAG: GTPase HflX [Candidatus Gottesmanbacteria bacterium RIFCSPLOWO2_01_FULL_46_9]